MPTYCYQRPFLYPKQEETFFNPKRITLAYGSTKSGKTFGASVWLFEQAIKVKRPTGVFLWLAPSTDQAKVAYSGLKAYLDPSLYSSNDSEMLLTLFNGNIMKFQTADDVNKVYGKAAWAVVLDEASRCRDDVWLLILSLTSFTKGPIRCISNVRGRNWFWKMYEAYKTNTSKNIFCTSINCWDAVDAGVLTREFIEQIREVTTDHEFKELYENIPADEGSNPFGYSFIQQACHHSNNQPRTLSNLEPVCFGIDLGQSIDWTVIIGLDVGGSVCHFERFQDTWEQTYNKILSLPVLPTIIDSTGLGDPIYEKISRDRPQTVSFKFTRTSRQQILEGLALAIQQGRTRFPKGIISDELEAFEIQRYPDHGFRYTSVARHDDTAISLALAYHIYSKPRNTYLTAFLDNL